MLHQFYQVLLNGLSRDTYIRTARYWPTVPEQRFSCDRLAEGFERHGDKGPRTKNDTLARHYMVSVCRTYLDREKRYYAQPRKLLLTGREQQIGKTNTVVCRAPGGSPKTWGPIPCKYRPVQITSDAEEDKTEMAKAD